MYRLVHPLVVSVVVYIIDDCHSDNQTIAKEAPPVGHLVEEPKTDDGGKNYLRVIVDTDFTSGSIGIGSGNGELSPGTAQTAAQKHEKLMGGGHDKVGCNHG